MSSVVIVLFILLMRNGTAVIISLCFFLMIRRPPRSTLDRSSAASDVYKRQVQRHAQLAPIVRQQLGLRVLLLGGLAGELDAAGACLLYTSPSPRARTRSRMPSSA